MRRERAPRCDVRSDHPLAVVRVEDVEPELVLGQPRLAGVAQQLLDLGADVDRQRDPGVVGLNDIEVDDEARDVLDEVREAALELRARDWYRPRRWRSPHSTHIDIPSLCLKRFDESPGGRRSLL